LLHTAKFVATKRTGRSGERMDEELAKKLARRLLRIEIGGGSVGIE
jgi:hypothetical protein